MLEYTRFHQTPNTMVEMRDGVKLATDVYLPADPQGKAIEGPWPTVLVRTPYDKTRLTDHASIVRLREYSLHGYAVVAQDCRGRHGSEGEFYPFLNEVNDGHDTLVWIGKQHWSNGKVGTIGTSYNAQPQSSLAVTNPPHLESQFVSQGYSNYHLTRTRTNGVFNLHRFEWFLRMAVESHEAKADITIEKGIQDMRDHLYEVMRDAHPIRPGQTPLARTPSYERALMDFMRNGDFSDYWLHPGLNLEPHFDDYKDIPITWLGSWYDGYSLDTVRNYEAMVARKKAPQRLIMGPWAHGMQAEARTYAGQVSFGEGSGFSTFEERLEWLDYTLKGIDNGASHRAPVRIFIMGGGSGEVLKGPRFDHLMAGAIDHGGYWRDEQEWPLARTQYTPYYLHGDGTLSADKPDVATSSTSYDFDPKNPVPSMNEPGKKWHQTGGPFLRAGVAFHQRDHLQNNHGKNHLPLSMRHDVLTFQTDVLEQDIELTGTIDVVLYVSSSALDTDFSAMLIDEYPPTEDFPEGLAPNLTFSIFRCRYHAGFDKPQLLEPGEVYEIKFTLPPIGNLFKAGHKIRVDISSSNWPEWEPNPNTGEAPGMQRRKVVAVNTVHHDRERPSHVVLPVIPTTS